MLPRIELKLLEQEVTLAGPIKGNADTQSSIHTNIRNTMVMAGVLWEQWDPCIQMNMGAGSAQTARKTMAKENQYGCP